MEWSVSDTDDAVVARLLFNSVVPRPIALVSTVSPAGVVNTAPFAFSGGVSHRPPMVYVAPDLRDGELKDTARNIKDTGQFVVNVVTEPMLERVVHAARAYQPDESEPEAVGLTLADARAVSPPRVADSPVSLECELWQMVWLPSGRPLILGEVVWIHARDDVLTDGVIDSRRLGAVGRLGDANFCRTSDVFAMAFPARI